MPASVWAATGPHQASTRFCHVRLALDRLGVLEREPLLGVALAFGVPDVVVVRPATTSSKGIGGAGGPRLAALRPRI